VNFELKENKKVEAKCGDFIVIKSNDGAISLRQVVRVNNTYAAVDVNDGRKTIIKDTLKELLEYYSDMSVTSVRIIQNSKMKLVELD
jgi:uncharacterized protein Veg